MRVAEDLLIWGDWGPLEVMYSCYPICPGTGIWILGSLVIFSLL